MVVVWDESNARGGVVCGGTGVAVGGGGGGGQRGGGLMSAVRTDAVAARGRGLGGARGLLHGALHSVGGGEDDGGRGAGALMDARTKTKRAMRCLLISCSQTHSYNVQIPENERKQI